MIQMVIDGFATSAAMKDKVNANTARIQELQEILADKPIVPPLLHSNMGNHYRKEVQNLISLMKDPEQRNEAILLIRALVEKIVLTPIEGSKKLSVDLYGDLAGILTMASGRAKPLEEIEEIVAQVKMVAGAGFEPAAFRL